MTYPIVQSAAQWTWTGAGTSSVQVAGYPPFGQPTKSGVTPTDLRNYVGVPIQLNGNPPIPINDSLLLTWIRWAEDLIEQDTNVRLCPTWIAAPAGKTQQSATAIGVGTVSGEQVLGQDYDLEEAPYDFRYEMAQDDGWMEQRLRWRPVKGPSYQDVSGLKNYAYIYPLLNSYFRVSASWFVVDPDYGIVRLVPSADVQMLPLFAMQIAFQGFSNSVPGGIWIQYCAGLTPNDYVSEYSFMRQYVLAVAAVTALGVVQGSINYGVTESVTTVDGLSQKLGYSTKGPYSGLITMQQAQI